MVTKTQEFGLYDATLPSMCMYFNGLYVCSPTKNFVRYLIDLSHVEAL